MRREKPDQHQVMDVLAMKWIGQGGVHGFDLDEHINCYLDQKDEKVQNKIVTQAGEYKVVFKYGPMQKMG